MTTRWQVTCVTALLAALLAQAGGTAAQSP